jgi:hypothetical protein
VQIGWCGADMTHKEIANQMLDRLLELVDATNWPEMKGDEFRGYESAIESVYDIITDYQDLIYKANKS